MSDERLRERLASLPESAPTLDSEARARVFATVAEVGPKVLVRARRQRAALQVGAGVASVTAAVAAGWLLIPANVTSTGPACADWEPVAATELSGRQVLGARGVLQSTPETVGHMTADGACKTILVLSRGRVRVEAHDLGGGELAVRTEEGVAAVHGTIFSVERQADAITIEVTQGRVSWTAPTATPIYLGANQRHVVQIIARNSAAESFADPGDLVADVPPLQPTPAKTEVRELPKARARALKPTVALSSSNLIQQAERLRRAGHTAEARSAYQAAGKHSDATAEAAWIALARYELELGQPRGAQKALRERARRFSPGVLAPEAEWISVQASALAGDQAGARTRAEGLIRRWPTTPQAKAAKAWLEANP